MDRRYSQEEVESIAAELLTRVVPHEDRATVVGLKGDLGAGKTTLTQALAYLLGVENAVVSPTFVIAKFYTPKHGEGWDELVHVDAYRIESDVELEPLGWAETIKRPRTLIIVEWPEKIASSLPVDTEYFSITHTHNGRHIKKV